MTSISLKNHLCKLILETEDDTILFRIEEYIRNIQSPKNENDWWDEISDEEKKSIEIGLAQADRGETIPYEEVRKSILERINQAR